VKRLAALLGRPLLVPVWVALVAIAVLLPRLGAPGLWEPQELAIADDASARADAAEKAPDDDSHSLEPVVAPLVDGRYQAARDAADAVRCPRASQRDDGPGTLTERMAARGLDSIESADADMRLGLVGLGVLCVLAVAGIAARLSSARGAAIAAAACLSFPLLALQSRQLTSELGTATGAALLVYGAVALTRPARGALALVDAAVAAGAIAAGTWLGWNSGGVLLGLLVPLIALAVAGGFGLGVIRATARLAPQAAVRAAAVVRPRTAIGRRRAWSDVAGASAGELVLAAIGLIATVAAAWLAIRLAAQIYDARPPVPGTRQILGRSILPSSCWSEDLGGIWKIDDDLRATYDSVFEQIAFGLFPFGLLAPIAMAALALGNGPDRDRRRFAGALTVAWAGAAWVAAQVWQRKVGFAIWPGFPAAAVAIGVWLDGVLTARDAEDSGGDGGGFPTRSLLVAVFVFLGVITVGKDVVAFPEKLVSLLVSGDAIKYPKTDARWLWVPLKAWVLVLGALFATALALGLALWRPRRADGQRATAWDLAGRHGVPVAIGLALAMSLFWIHVWHAGLSRGLSSKKIFTSFHEQRRPDDTLGIMGDMANAPRYYAGTAWERIAGRDALASFLARDRRVFALVPAAELCPIHREFAGKPYYVLDDSNVRTLLLSNRLDGAVDRNPLATAIRRSEPSGIQSRPTGRIVWDDKIELVGWTLPAKVGRGNRFQTTLVFKILGNIPGAWKIFAHFDGGGLRFQGDHDPIGGRCATSYWQPGDYVVDTFSVEAGDVTFQRRDYELRIGFFTGSSPNWKNMTISDAPPALRDKNDRVLVGKIRVD
jgi:hypothetical protein